MRRSRGTTVAEMLVACGLFTVFMMICIGMFTSMTKMVGKEQTPAERLAEGRTAALTLARRVRNCSGFVKPALWQVLRSKTDQLMLRDQVLGKTVEIKMVGEVLTESYYPLEYNPLVPNLSKVEKGLRLTTASSFSMVGGGLAHPTRMNIEIELLDGRKVRAVSNFREAI